MADVELCKFRGNEMIVALCCGDPLAYEDTNKSVKLELTLICQE